MPPPVVPVPIAHVAPGTAGYNLLCTPGIAGMILGDFERSGTVNHTDPEYLVRLLRPGAILLANLDIDDAARLAALRPGDLATALDAIDARVNGPDDSSDLTTIKVRKPDPCGATAAKVVIRVHSADANRIRLFQIGAGPDPIVGAGKPAAPRNEFTLPDEVPGVVWAFDYLVEALTLPGDPALPAPGGASPNKPDPYPATLPTGSSGAPVYAVRGPADVWVELIHQNSGGADVPVPRDVAVLTIAPFLLLSNLQPADRIYAVYRRPLNHDFTYDLAEAFGGPLPASTSAPFTPSTPTSVSPLYLIDGALYPDEWAQDEMEIGYCWAPHHWMHVVLHCKRGRGLNDFVHKEIVDRDYGLFDALHGSASSLNYGGNLEVSPPVAVATPALPRGAGAAGPSLPAHRPAPFGKIIVGDCTPRPIHPDFRRFLLAQKVQPVLALNTSWLDVGHVDEFMSFVPISTGKRFKLLFASVFAMKTLLEEIRKIPIARRTGFHRGKWAGSRLSGPTPGSIYDEVSVEELLGPTKTYNDALRTSTLIPLQERMERGLALAPDGSDVVRVPVYFEKPAAAGGTTFAKTVGMVNLQLNGSHLYVPKPFGARALVADATAALRSALDRMRLTAVAVRTASATGDWFWVRRDESLHRVACYFTQPPTAADRLNIRDHITSGAAMGAAGTPLNAVNTPLVAAMEAAILADPVNTAAPNPVASVLSGGVPNLFTDWRRVWIPEPTVDLIESYMLSVLEPLGFTVHFIDDWFYHAGIGEVHCGTNAKRKPPELSDPALRWWTNYDPGYNFDYDPAA